jgi:acyl carrier protein phosphodiesterase
LVGGDGRVEQRLAQLATWANGRIEWLKDYRDLDEARAAAERLAQERGRRSEQQPSLRTPDDG